LRTSSRRHGGRVDVAIDPNPPPTDPPVGPKAVWRAPKGATKAETSSRRPAPGVTTRCRPRSQRADPSTCPPRGRLSGRSLADEPLVGGGSGGKTPSPANRPSALGGSTLPGQMLLLRDHFRRRRRHDLRDATEIAPADALGWGSMVAQVVTAQARPTSLHAVASKRAAQRSPPGRSRVGRAAARGTETRASIVAMG